MLINILIAVIMLTSTGMIYIPLNSFTEQFIRNKNQSSEPFNSNDNNETYTVTASQDPVVQTPDIPASTGEIVYEKPDYSTIIKRVEEIKQCWTLCEKYTTTTVSDKRPDWCKNDDLGVDKKLECTRLKAVTVKKEVSCETERSKALSLLNKALSDLSNGIFVDIYDTTYIPSCPGRSQTLHREL